MLDTATGAHVSRIVQAGQIIGDTRYDRFYVYSGTTVYVYDTTTDAIVQTWATASANPFTEAVISRDNATLFLLEPVGRVIYRMSTVDGSYTVSPQFNYSAGTAGSTARSLRISPSGLSLFLCVNVDPTNTNMDGAGQGDIFIYTISSDSFVRCPNVRHPTGLMPLSDNSTLSDNSSVSSNTVQQLSFNGSGGFAGGHTYGNGPGVPVLQNIGGGTVLPGGATCLVLSSGTGNPHGIALATLVPAPTGTFTGLTASDLTKYPTGDILALPDGSGYWLSGRAADGIYKYGIASNSVTASLPTQFASHSLALGMAAVPIGPPDGGGGDGGGGNGGGGGGGGNGGDGLGRGCFNYVHWNAVSGATSYNLRRGPSETGPWTTVANGITATHCEDQTTSAQDGMTLDYEVQAAQGMTLGPWSAAFPVVTHCPNAYHPCGCSATWLGDVTPATSYSSDVCNGTAWTGDGVPSSVWDSDCCCSD